MDKLLTNLISILFIAIFVGIVLIMANMVTTPEAISPETIKEIRAGLELGGR